MYGLLLLYVGTPTVQREQMLVVFLIVLFVALLISVSFGATRAVRVLYMDSRPIHVVAR